MLKRNLIFFKNIRSYFLYDNVYVKLKDASSSSVSSSVPQNSHSSFCFSQFFPSRSLIFYSCVLYNIAAFLPFYRTDLPIKFLILLHLNQFKVKATSITRISPLPRIWTMSLSFLVVHSIWYRLVNSPTLNLSMTFFFTCCFFLSTRGTKQMVDTF